MKININIKCQCKGETSFDNPPKQIPFVVKGKIDVNII